MRESLPGETRGSPKPDVYATITEADAAMQERLAEVLELRAADPRQRAMLAEYTAQLDLADGNEPAGGAPGPWSRSSRAR